MKLKIIGSLITFLLVILTILLFIDSESVTRIIVSPKIYSLLKSSDTEYFNLTMLVNDKDTYYFNEDYITNVYLSSDSEDIIPLNLTEIKKSNDYYIYDSIEYNYIDFMLEIGFDSDDYLIKLEKAYLNITYSNGGEIVLYIGEFNYYFKETFTSDLGISNLLATNELIASIDTASGLFLKLDNLSEYNIIINKIELGSASIKANNFYLKEIYEIPEYSETPEEVLSIADYNFEIYGETEKDILLRKNNEIMLYVPFSYSGEIPYLYRFYIIVHYEMDGVLKEFVIDDFPFIYTSNYKLELESTYNHYEFKN